jgi:hypothetical protein
VTPGRCLDCQAEFPEPSYSEGPKTVNPATGVEDRRGALPWFLCPTCLSRNIEPIAT